MSISRKYFILFFIFALLLPAYDLSAFVIVLKNGKKIEVEKYIDYKDKIKVIHNNVTLYIPKENIDYISPSSAKPKASPTPQAEATVEPTPAPVPEAPVNVPKYKPEDPQDTKIEEKVISPEPAVEKTVSEETSPAKAEPPVPPANIEKPPEEEKKEPVVIKMRGADKEYFEKWEESDFEPHAWEIYNNAKDMGGADLEFAIESLKQALEYDPHNDKIKMTIAEKSGELPLL